MPSTPAIVHARVCARGISIPYAQAGQGASVVLLSVQPDADHTRLLLFRELSRYFRVVAPVLERGGRVYLDGDGGVSVAFSRWLSGFLDGLGISGTSIVAEEPFGVPALAYAMLDPDRVQRIVLGVRDAHDSYSPPAVARDVLGQTGTSVMVLPVESDHIGTFSGDLIRFLADGKRPTPASGSA